MKLKISTLLIINLLSTFSMAQICNFCSREELIYLLNQNKIDYNSRFDSKNVEIIEFQNNSYKKSWFLKYNTCYLYKITILDKQNSRSLKKMIDRNFIKRKENLWEDFDNTIIFHKFENNYSYNFYPKISLSNLNKHNF